MATRRIAAPKIALAIGVALLTALLHITSFPFAFHDGHIWSVPEAAYLFLIPVCLWLWKPRGFWTTLCVGLGSGWLSWLVLLWWLRHVTYGGTIFLSFILALFIAGWVLAARWALPRMRQSGAGTRILGIAGLAALWILLEWLRSWIFSGFPWLPVAASQWDRPILLQILPWTGYLGLSFVLVYVNIALACYLQHLANPKRGVALWRKLSPELYSGLGLLLLTVVIAAAPNPTSRAEPQRLFDAGFVQPYIPQELKWDADHARENLKTLERDTAFAAHQDAELLLWPEASTPWPIVNTGDTGMRDWAESLSSGLGKPILMGNGASVDNGKGGRTWYNGIFYVDPQDGLSDTYYAKRKLVPYGEYDPLSWLPFDLGLMPNGSFTPGTQAEILNVNAGGATWRAGPLVCYEDIFPQLARDDTLAGADFLFVATNNAWYGEEAGAYQHAVHSILRAVENRRPVLRCGNGGWSGWINEYGGISFVATRPGEGVYFEGSDVVSIYRNPALAGTLTFYTQFGDWITMPAALLAVLVFFLLWRRPYEPEPAPVPPAEPLAGERDTETEARKKARELLSQGKFGRLQSRKRRRR